jgi:glyoxylase-like metal-dependent hydrolase (beta-lactamase superfamily II)
VPDFEIHPLDLRFNFWPESIASFLVMGPKGAALVETGPSSTLPRLQTELLRHGVSPADVHDVFVTHIHLDHAGASGWWAQQGARIHVHHVGAPHLIDPSKLLASAQRIYGDRMEHLWGEILPVASEHVHPLHDGDLIQAGGLTFEALDTPGHARHHMVYRLDDVAFTGDSAGIRMPGQVHIQVPTVPPEFDLEAWQGSLERMRARRFARLYLTHFGLVEEADEHLATVASLLAEFAGRVRQEMMRGASRQEILEQMGEWEKRLQVAGTGAQKAETGSSGCGSFSTYVDGAMRYWRKHLGLDTSDS